MNAWCNKYTVYALKEDSESWEDWIHQEKKNDEQFLLPDYLLFDILLNLPDLQSIFSSLLTCKTFYQTIDTNLFWKKYYYRYFLQKLPNDCNNAKELFTNKFKNFNLSININLSMNMSGWSYVNYLDYFFKKYERTRQFLTLRNIIINFIKDKIGFNIISKIYFSCVKKCSKGKGAGVNLFFKLNEHDNNGYVQLYIYEILCSLESDFLSLMYRNKILYKIVPYFNVTMKGCVNNNTYIFRLFNANNDCSM